MDNQFNEPIAQGSQKIGTIISTILITAIVIGGGVWWWQKSAFEKEKETLQQQITQLQNQITSLSAEQETENITQQQDQFADWQTYRNEEYGFEVKYPTSWAIDQNRTIFNEVVFDIGIPGSRESVKFEKNTNNLTLQQIKSQKFQNESIIIDESQLTVDGENTLRIDTSEFGQTYIIFLHNDFIYTITTGGYFIDNQILSTFKFID